MSRTSEEGTGVGRRQKKILTINLELMEISLIRQNRTLTDHLWQAQSENEALKRESQDLKRKINSLQAEQFPSNLEKDEIEECLSNQISGPFVARLITACRKQCYDEFQSKCHCRIDNEKKVEDDSDNWLAELFSQGKNRPDSVNHLPPVLKSIKVNNNTGESNETATTVTKSRPKSNRGSPIVTRSKTLTTNVVALVDGPSRSKWKRVSPIVTRARRRLVKQK